MSRSNTYGRISATYQSIEDTSKFEDQQWPKGKGTKRPTMAKRKRDKKTNNNQKKKGQKDKKWSTKYYTEN